MTYEHKNSKNRNSGQDYGTKRQFNGKANDNFRKPKQQPAAYKGFEPRNDKQREQAAIIDKSDFAFCVGPAGTGKTHVAMAKAVEAFQDPQSKIEKILIARPALESGEKLGYQPGDQNAKMAPYMRPLYDELDKALGEGAYQNMLENGTLEIVPIGFMRGRTFENAFIVVDEAQNCQYEQLKMAITRLGPNSKMVITGDPDQSDFDPKELSGLKPLVEELDGVEGVGFHYYTANNVVRHPTVQRILERLDEVAQKKAANTPKGPGAQA